MTRINLVSPEELTDQHLMAEYREIPMVPAALRRSMRTKSVSEILKSVPKQFTLNKGHVTFFYNKLLYLDLRYRFLVHELLERGYDLNYANRFNIEEFPPELCKFWEPSARDLSIIRERIHERIMQKPQWYTRYKKPYIISLLSD